ncbi:MAG: hypothetical protein HY060_17615 [Proteobacteria bacterium]|nr:hypothetical protein [Pseudomonadota bacterium]
MAVALAAAALSAGPTHAQAPGPHLGPTLTSPVEISTCLCLEREIATRQAELTVYRNVYDGLGQAIREAVLAIDRERPLVNVDDPAAVDGFRRRLDELDAMKARRDQVALPDYQAAVASYSERVAQYTQACSGRALDPRLAEQVRQTLSCRSGP